jgi:hypothetical protein
MLAYLFLGLLLLVGILGLLRWAAEADPRLLARIVKVAAIVLGSAGLLLFLWRGGAGLLPLLSVVLLPLILRWRSGRLRWKAAAGPSPGRTSDVSTAYLQMRLHHDTGALEGTVLTGTYAGRSLDSLSLDDLLAVLRECSAADPESIPVLEAYLDRVHGPDWRDRGAGQQESRPDGAAARGMTRAEALAILGLEEGAEEEAIKEAHRRLMQRNHPDRGGSTYLAARINEARDLLLGD